MLTERERSVCLCISSRCLYIRVYVDTHIVVVIYVEEEKGSRFSQSRQVNRVKSLCVCTLISSLRPASKEEAAEASIQVDVFAQP